MRIRCAADLFSVLSSGTMGSQLAVLRDIARDPRRAAALGRHEQEDVVDLLLRLVAFSFGPIKQAQVVCLMSYDDPRVTDYLVAEFSRSTDPAIILHLAKRLSLAKDSEFFRPFLWNQNRAHALAAARHCSQGMELSAKERLRVAILLDQPFEPPAFSEEALEVWMEALAGPERVRVRQLAEQRGEEVMLLWTRFATLAEAEQEWLVEVSARRNPALLLEKIPELLRQPSVSLAIVEYALQLGVELPPDLLNSPHERVRALAISSGLADDRLETFLDPQVSALEAAAAARRCPIARLVELLSDPRWEVRAAATDTLAQRDLQELPLETIRSKTASALMGERVAAVELLRRLEDTQWLQDNLTA